MRTLTVIYLIVAGGLSTAFAADLDKNQSPPTPPPEQPVAAWVKTLRTSNLTLIKTVWSDEVVKRQGVKRETIKDKEWKDMIKLHAKLWVDQFPGAKTSDFTFFYAGDKSKGKVTVKYKGKKVDPKLISPLPVVWENGSWKRNTIPGP